MSRYAAYVGWDWAEQEHELRMRAADSEVVEQRKLASTPAALHGWAAEMRERFEGRPVAVCIETSRGAVIWALMGYEHIVLYPVNPKSAASFRETFYPSGKKDDPVDAAMLLELVDKHADKLRPLNPADAATRSLGILSEHRRKLVHELVRETNRLRTNLKGYFPQALELVGELDTPMSCAFLKRWASVNELRAARPKTLEAFYREHGSRSSNRIEQRIESVRSLVALSEDRAVVDSGVIVTRSLVMVIEALTKAIAQIESPLAALYAGHAEHDLIDSFPGLGMVLGSRVIALLGSDRARFASDEELQRLSGIAPVTKRSGGTHGQIIVQRRLKRSKFLHQTIVEWAGQSIARSVWARAFYDLNKAQGKRHWVILRSLGYKWVRILFRCWKERCPYDEQKHIEQLSLRGSGIAAHLKTAA